MESQRIAKLAVGSIVTLGAIFLLGVFGSSRRVQAQNAPTPTRRHSSLKVSQ